MIGYKDVTLFLNPSSRSGRGKRLWRYFRKEGFREIVTKDGEDLVRQVERDDRNIAVAVGGDGTINLVINGIMRAGGHRTLGVLYAGTSPDFCQFHGIPVEPEQAVDVLCRGKGRRIDLCKVESDGKTFWFASSCNIGLGASVACISNRIRKYVGDFPGTLIALLVSLVKTRAFDVDVTDEEGKVHTIEKVRHVVVMKNNLIASGLHLQIPAQPDDGLLHMATLGRLSLKDLAGLYKGVIPRGATVLSGRSFDVTTDRPVEIEYDGDPKGICTPVKITCTQQALEVIQ